MAKGYKFSRKQLIYLGIIALVGLIIGGSIIFATRTKLPHSINAQPKAKLSIEGQGKTALNHPLAVAISANGQVYVTDSGNNQVKAFQSDGTFALAFGQAGRGEGQFNTPYGIGFLADGSLLVSDMLNYRIQHFDKQGKFLGLFLAANSGIKPGMLLIQDKRVYVSDLAAHQIVVFSESGQVMRKYTGDLNFPQGLAVSGDNLLVADAGNNVIKVFSGNSAGKTFGGANKFKILRGLAVDNLQRVLAVDSMDSQVKFFSDSGKVLFAIGSAGRNLDQFMYPSGIAIDQSGQIYVADWGNNRIQVWGY